MVQNDVIDIQRAFWAALQAKDTASFERILVEDFVSVSPNQTRTQFIETLTSFPMQVESVDCEDLQVHLFGDVAVLTGTQVARLKLPNGASVSDTIAITNIFHRTSEGWRLVLARPVQLPNEQ
ncbi:MAG TPA: nuclear transport factor 2 family protein [Oceanobacillus sp.]|nr:nuclear transport factor 2 family protein [Oceanobacillus sp.]